MTYEQAATLIGERVNGAVVVGSSPLVVTVPPEQWLPMAEIAKDTLRCRFFSFLSAVDWKEQGLELIARVENLDDNVAVMMKTQLGPGVSDCASIVPLYRGANWMERECWDMFGIRFAGHPDLRRILLDDTWVGHPLLKSYAVDTPYPPYR